MLRLNSRPSAGSAMTACSELESDCYAFMAKLLDILFKCRLRHRPKMCASSVGNSSRSAPDSLVEC